MNALVIYDSQFGNTEQIARAIGRELSPSYTVTIARIKEIVPARLAEYDLIVAGSPTQRFRPTAGMTEYLKSIPAGALAGIRVAAFDTRLTVEEIEKVAILAFFVRIFGYAAAPIARQLMKKGGRQAAAPEGYYVAGMEGPLVSGELERASSWARSLALHP